jgi:hypothetical protein
MRGYKKRRVVKGNFRAKPKKPRKRRKIVRVFKKYKKPLRRAGMALGAAGLLAAGVYTGGDLVPLVGRTAAGMLGRAPYVGRAMKVGARVQRAIQKLAGQQGRIGGVARGFRNAAVRRGANWTAGDEPMDWEEVRENAANLMREADRRHKSHVSQRKAALAFSNDRHAMPSDDQKVIRVKKQRPKKQGQRPFDAMDVDEYMRPKRERDDDFGFRAKRGKQDLPLPIQRWKRPMQQRVKRNKRRKVN